MNTRFSEQEPFCNGLPPAPSTIAIIATEVKRVRATLIVLPKMKLVEPHLLCLLALGRATVQYEAIPSFFTFAK